MAMNSLNEERALGALRWAVIVMFVLAIAACLFVPVYTDEIGWRFQERAGFDGVDKMYTELCGPNTLAVPPFFMWPVRWFSALFNGLFSGPLWVRLSGIGYALALGALIIALIRRLADDHKDRASLIIVGIGLLCFANTPLLLSLSRPEQPLMLALTGALILALSPDAASPDAAQAGRAIAWRRSLIILALAVVALSYHLKGLLLVPAMLACLFFASRGRQANGPRAVAALLLAGAAALAVSYWQSRFSCPGDPIIARELARNSASAALGSVRSVDDAAVLATRMFGNISVFDYVRLATPEQFPLSQWLPYQQITRGASFTWFVAQALVWGLGLGVAAVCFGLGSWRALRERRLDPRLVLAFILAGTFIAWSAIQNVRNFYEAGWMLPLLMLTAVLALSAVPKRGMIEAAMQVVTAVVGIAALVSPPLIAQLWQPAAARAAQSPGYIADQVNSVSVFGYGKLRPQILETAKLCGIPPPDQARAVLIDDVTYFTYMDSLLPQHRLGLTGGWKGTNRDPIGYLKAQQSSGVVMGCQLLPPDLRARAKANGQFCCLGPPGW